MKKIFAIMLVLVMMFAVAVPTFAAKSLRYYVVYRKYIDGSGSGRYDYRNPGGHSTGQKR